MNRISARLSAALPAGLSAIGPVDAAAILFHFGSGDIYAGSDSPGQPIYLYGNSSSYIGDFDSVEIVPMSEPASALLMAVGSVLRLREKR